MEEKNQFESNDKQGGTPVQGSNSSFSGPVLQDESSPEPLLAEALPKMEESLADAEQVKEPTRFQLFMRKALTWLAVVLIAFLGGMITFYFAFYQPKVDQLNQTETTLSDAMKEVSDLQNQLETVTAQRDAMETANDYRALLSVLADIYEARLALAEENSAAAKSALSDTTQTLNEIIDVIRNFDTKLAETIPQRLKLIQTNLDGNIENAIADCDLMIKDLQTIEKALYQ